MRTNYTDKMLNSLYTTALDKDMQTTDVTGMTVMIRTRAKGFNDISFRCMKIINGKRHDWVLGRYPKTKLIEARKMYLEYIGNIAEGIDPTNKDMGKEKSVTFGELWREYRALKDVELKAHTIEKYASAWNAHLYSLDNVDIKLINPESVMNLLNPLIKEKGYATAQKLAQMIRAIVDYAVFKELLQYNSVAKITKYLPTPKYEHIKTFSDTTMKEDLIGLFNDMAGEDKTYQMLVYMYFFTLLRSVELRKLRIDVIDLHNNLFTVKTKTKDKFTVPLTKQARMIVDYMIEHHIEKHNPYLFTGTAEDGIVSENTINKMFKRIGYADKLRVHGIRSCGRQWLQVQPEIKESIIEMCLGHVVGSQVVQAYHRGEYIEDRLYALQVWSDFICECAGDNFSNLFKN